MAASPTDGYANRGDYYIYFQSLHTPSANVKFKAFVTDLSQEFTTNWNSQTVFGRMDPIQTFQNTQRTISLSWKTTSYDSEEAAENLKKINLLTKMLYPTYDDAGREADLSHEKNNGKDAVSSFPNALTIAKPPLMRVRFVNLIQASPNKGLIAAIAGFSYSSDLAGDEVVFDFKNNIIPKTITVSCTINVLHEYDLGWSQDGEWLGDGSFPFATSPADLTETLTQTNPSTGGADDTDIPDVSDASVENAILSNTNNPNTQGN